MSAEPLYTGKARSTRRQRRTSARASTLHLTPYTLIHKPTPYHLKPKP